MEFTAFVREHRRRLVRSAFLLCGSWAHAEDVTQISLEKLYVAWPRIRSRGPDAYVRTIITRTVIDESRRPWRRESPVDAQQLTDTPAADPRADTGVGPDLLRALLTLPVRQRQTVVLRHYWGLSVEETAQHLGISTGSVKSHCSRGMHQLDTLLHPVTQKVEGR
ncbi:MAG: SigE family RNA polymerase sigma factor [Janthinobacterium lividum]